MNTSKKTTPDNIREQYVGKCNHCGYVNKFQLPIGKHLPEGIYPKFCMMCKSTIEYQLKR